MKSFLLLLLFSATAAFALTDAELDSIGRRVWQNECGGTRDGLTSWNAGENFASLGIGHFIWYSKGARGPFEESFPGLVRFLSANGVKTPSWLAGDCPWRSRAEFQSAFRSARMNELRTLLAATIRLQSRYLAQRMQRALPRMVRAAPAAQRKTVQAQYARLAATGAGTFALIDYVNFKGEGVNAGERYRGQGWGLLQVLLAMRTTSRATQDFAAAAAETLERRVRNAPPSRGEARWLPGWRARVSRYAR